MTHGCPWRRGGVDLDIWGLPHVPAATFSDGKLWLPGAGLVIRPWPVPAAWSKGRGAEPWRRVNPRILLDTGHYIELEETELRTVSPADRERRDRIRQSTDAWLSFHHAIPSDVLHVVERFDVDQWALLSLIARCDGAFKLATETPALAFCLTAAEVFHRPPVAQPLRAARSLLRRGDLALLRWLGFDGTEVELELLRKVQYRAMNVPSLLLLRRALREPDCVELLVELPALHSGLIQMVLEPDLRRLFTAEELKRVLVMDPERAGDLVQILTGLGTGRGEREAVRERREYFLTRTERLAGEAERWVGIGEMFDTPF